MISAKKMTIAAAFMVPLLPALVFAQTSTSSGDMADESLVNKVNILQDAVLDLFENLNNVQQQQQIRQREKANEEIKNKYAPKPLDDFRIEFDSDNFTPGERITATASTYGADISGKFLTWYLNGEKVKSGAGEVAYSFVVGPAGEPMTVKATISNEGVSASRTIYPAKIHLIWSSDTRTPSWYKGKALAAPGSEVTVTAVVDFKIGNKIFDKGELIYTWYVDNSMVPIGDGSGVGRDSYSISFSTTRGVSYKFGVNIRDGKKRFSQTKTITIQSVDPINILYEDVPLYGTDTANAIHSIARSGGEQITLRIEPFYLPEREFANLEYSWKIDDAPIKSDNPSDRLLKLNIDPASGGAHRIEIKYENPDNVLTRGFYSTLLKIRK